jgi:hypothetical protein
MNDDAHPSTQPERRVSCVNLYMALDWPGYDMLRAPVIPADCRAAGMILGGVD